MAIYTSNGGVKYSVTASSNKLTTPVMIDIADIASVSGGGVSFDGSQSITIPLAAALHANVLQAGEALILPVTSNVYANGLSIYTGA